MPTFVGRVESPDGKGAQSFVELPPELLAGLGRGKKPPIKLTLKGYTYRTTVAIYGGQYLVPVRREVREAAGIIFDEPIEITVELDQDERTVEIPAELTTAFEVEPDLRGVFDRLAFTARRELVDSIVKRYELQVLDSCMAPLADGNDAAAIYGLADASVNASRPAGTWQSYDVTFRAARFADGAKVENARVSVTWNGTPVHQDLELPGPTPGGAAETPDPGPILLQDHGHPVRYRNLWLQALDPR